MAKINYQPFLWAFSSLCYCFLYGNERNFSSLEEEYTPKYCLQLEAAYGNGMMSEGGTEAIEHMFSSIPLKNKKALDIGSGLGGVAFYLADTYSMNITGLEVNSWMVAESIKRIPKTLQDRVNFFQSFSNNDWPFDDESYDILYSKGVLTHVEYKDELFQECYRILKKGGYFVISDWLSSEDRTWGEHIGRLVELEDLVLFAENETNYVTLLKKAGFTVVSVHDDSDLYHRFNIEIADRLRNAHSLCIDDLFEETELSASIEGYESIAKAIKAGELRVVRFIVRKE